LNFINPVELYAFVNETITHIISFNYVYESNTLSERSKFKNYKNALSWQGQIQQIFDKFMNQ